MSRDEAKTAQCCKQGVALVRVPDYVSLADCLVLFWISTMLDAVRAVQTSPQSLQ